MLADLISASPPLVWGLFTRGLGLVYLVAFASLYRDVLPIAGSRGISPIAPQLAAIARDFPGPARLLRFPTLLWLGAGDRALRAWIVLGMIAAVAVVVGVLSPIALALCWAIYLSFDLAMDMLYPWDSVLLEAGLLAMLLPSLAPLPDLAATAAPFPLLAWAYRWLLFRVVFGFGKYKFFGPGKLHLDYLKSFVLSQPLSTPIAYHAARLPRWVFAIALFGLFVVEVPVPFLIFATPELRVIAAMAIAALMIGIQLSGNFGFFNLVVLVLCIPLFDAHASITDTSLFSLAWPLDHLLATALAITLFAGGLLSLPFNSWVAQAWPYWPAWLRAPRIVRFLVGGMRLIAPFRVVHAYGVFSPESGPPVKWAPRVEGTRDGEHWEPYRFRFMPSGPHCPPRFVAPLFPRFDHALIYDALGISLSGLTASVFAVQNPYRCSRHSWMERLAQRLLEGSPEVRALFAHDPFGDHPPRAVRVRLVALERAPEHMRRASGQYWIARDVATHLPPAELDPDVWRRWIAPPELFAWDDEIWRQRSRRFQSRLARDEDPAQLARFEDELVPIVQRVDPKSWAGLSEAIAALRARFDREELDAFEALTARLALRLAARFEETERAWLDAGLLAHAALLCGSSVVRALETEPMRARELLGDPDLGRGMLLWACFRPQTIAFHARKARLRELTLRGAVRDPPPIVPAILRWLPHLASRFPDPHEHLPRYVRTHGGWSIEREPAPGRSLSCGAARRLSVARPTVADSVDACSCAPAGAARRSDESASTRTTCARTMPGALTSRGSSSGAGA